MRARNSYSSYFFAAIVLILSGCGGGDQVTTNPNDPVVIEPTPLLITPQDGLSKSFDSGNIIINIGANAVSQDTEITYTKTLLDDDNQTNNIISDIHTLSPQDKILNKTFEIAIKIPSEYKLGGQLHIARLSDNQWVNITDSIVVDDLVKAQVSRLGSYALRFERLVQSAQFGPQCDATASEQAIRFIHVADLHARFGYKEQYFSRIKAYHKQALADSPYTLFTNGGDDYEKGTIAEQLSQGLATEEAIKALTFDLKVLGNHDYAWGPEKLLQYSQDPNAIVLASNTRFEGPQAQFNGVDFAKVQVGCLTLGVFGMTSVPWDELDNPFDDEPIPDFIQRFRMSWKWQDIAQSIVTQYRDEVDYMIMLSHLGEGSDTRIAENVTGIDLVLGGHTHGGESYNQLDNGALVIQPDFYAQGVTDLTLTFNLKDKTLQSHEYQTIETDSIDTIDQDMQNAIDRIMGKYAPDAQTEIAISENYLSDIELAQVTALAAEHVSTISAAMLSPELVQRRWTPGTLTQEDFHQAYLVERQPSNTPGFNSIYKVTVSGSELNNMLAAKPDWLQLRPESINPDENYDVAVFKGVALNPELFFTDVSFENIELINEAWWILDKYARYRTSQCLHIDTDRPLNACNNIDNTTIWNFDDINNPLKADVGPSVLSYFDPNNTGWGPNKTQYNTTTAFGISDLHDGESSVMAFTDHSPTEGLYIQLNTAANGDFIDQGLVSDYTVVMDIYWPFATKDIYRALLQTDTVNYLADDADIFISNTGGLGISTRDSGYFGATEPDKWHRIAFVFYTAPSNGVFEVYIDGQLAGIKRDGQINKRWALNKALLLFTDENYETEPGFLNALLYSGRAMSRDEIKRMGGASQQLTFEPTMRQLNQVIQRHYEAAPAIQPNLWLEQRNKFFNKRAQP